MTFLGGKAGWFLTSSSRKAGVRAAGKANRTRYKGAPQGSGVPGAEGGGRGASPRQAEGTAHLHVKGPQNSKITPIRGGSKNQDVREEARQYPSLRAGSDPWEDGPGTGSEKRPNVKQSSENCTGWALSAHTWTGVLGGAVDGSPVCV